MTRQPQVGDVYEHLSGKTKGKRIRLDSEFVNTNPFPRRAFNTTVVHHPFARRMIGYTSHIAAYRLLTSQFRYIEEIPMSTPTFRKKPVEIQAMQWDGTRPGAKEIMDWVMYYPHSVIRTDGDPDSSEVQIVIETLEGRMKASPGDWIIRGVEGEFYPCKPEIFAKTYDAVVPPVARKLPLVVGAKGVDRQIAVAGLTDVQQRAVQSVMALHDEEFAEALAPLGLDWFSVLFPDLYRAVSVDEARAEIERVK